MKKIKSKQKRAKPAVNMQNLILATIILLVVVLAFSFALKIKFPAAPELPASTPTPSTQSDFFDLGPQCALTAVSAAGLDISAISDVMQAASVILSPGAAAASFAVGQVLKVIPAIGDVLKAKECVETPQKCATAEIMKAATSLIPPPAGPLIKAGLQSCTNAQEKLEQIGEQKIANVRVDIANGEVSTELHGVTKEAGDVSELLGEKEGFLYVGKDFALDRTQEGIITLTAQKEGQIKLEGKVLADISKDSYIKIRDGEIIEASLVTTKTSLLKFQNIDSITVPAKTKVDFVGGQLVVEGKGKDILFGEAGSENKIKILGENINIAGKKITGKNFEIDGIKISGAQYIINRPEVVIGNSEFGSISLIEGGYKIDKGTTAEIYGLKMKGKAGWGVSYATGDDRSEFDLYLDGKEHEGSYVSLNSDEKALISKSNEKGGMGIGFSAENPFVNIEKDDYLDVKNIQDSKIIITNREYRALIPLIEISHYSDDSGVNFMNGNTIFDSFTAPSAMYSGEEEEFSKQRILTKNEKTGVHVINMNAMRFGDQGSSPLEIIMKDNEGNNLLGAKEKPKKIVLTNFNEMQIKPADETGELEETTIYYNYDKFNKGYFKEKYPTIKLGAATSEQIKTVSEHLDKIDPSLIPDIKKIRFIPNEKWKFPNVWPWMSDAGAYANPLNDNMVIRGDNYKDYNLFRHELAHLTQFNIDRGSSEDFYKKDETLKQDIINKVEEFAKENDISMDVDPSFGPGFVHLYPTFASQQDEFKFYIVQKEIEPYLDEKSKEHQDSYEKASWGKDSFANQWEEVAGLEKYGETVAKVKGYPYPVWKGEAVDTALEARQGIAQAYGAQNIYEDVATMVEAVVKDGDFFKPLLNPKSDRYDPRYIKKLDILKEKGFITQQEYDKVTKID